MTPPPGPAIEPLGKAVIRPARAADLAAVRACAQAAYAPYVARIGREPAPMRADFAAALARGALSVLALADAVIGFIVCEPRGDHLHIENIAVLPERQGRGHGGQLLAFAEATARRLDRAAIELYTHIAMHENQALYRQRGYRETGRARQDGFARIFYRKPLPPR